MSSQKGVALQKQLIIGLFMTATTFISYQTFRKYITSASKISDVLPIQISPREMENMRQQQKHLKNKSYLIIDCRGEEEIQNRATLQGDDWIHIEMKDLLNTTSKSSIKLLLKRNNINNNIEHLYLI
eukprot:237668_1